MPAGDLPEQGHAGGLAMARKLVTYMDDARAVRQAIASEFDRVPTHRTIRELRERHIASLRREPVQSFKIEAGYCAAQESRRLDEPNRIFLARLAVAYPERFAA